MAQTLTKTIPLGFTAPNFSLTNVVSGNQNTFNDLSGINGTVIMFICNHCPFVVHVIDAMIALAHDYNPKGIAFVAISANDIDNYPDDRPDKMKEMAIQRQFPFPYLFDETQDIARAYNAACTPDFNVFNHQNNCIYRGQMDDSRPGNDLPSNGKDLRKVLEYVLEKKQIDFEQKPSMGCNIKWKNQ
ncbi:thioredoxin family protein [Flavobacteriales bacterium]|nr:thioredoxin family protein [Flavobacteriales bacterium]MDC3337561.1 thioredoxin family protein [Flavobacteriales bacterium]